MIDYSKDLEDAESLDQEEIEPLEFWVSKQKELVTSVVDYNLSTLVDLIRDQAIDLDPRYQRRLRWDSAKQSRLIESFLMNVPVPPVFLNEDEYGRYSVIDGKQRLAAIYNFFNNNLMLEKLKIFSDINENKFADLPIKLRNIIRTRPTIRAVIILKQSDRDIKYEVFQRLNTGGAHLNAQEIRNNAFHGSLNSLIMEISESRLFHASLGIKNKQKSGIYQEMRDAELVLRYFTFKDNWETFTGGLKSAMDAFMENHRNPSESDLDALRSKFRNTIGVVTAVFGEHAFHRWMPERQDWRRHVLASLYDAEMFACQDFIENEVRPHSNQIIGEFKKLFSDDAFRRSIDAATNSSSFFKDRIRTLKNLITKVIRS